MDPAPVPAPRRQAPVRAVAVAVGLAGLLAWAASPRDARANGAYPVHFDVTYTITGGQSCSRFGCTPVVPGAPAVGGFVLSSADLAADGAYDVLASYTNPLLIQPAPSTTPTRSAVATVVAGIATKLVATLSYSQPLLPGLGGTFSYSFSAGDGTWSSLQSSSPPPPLPTSTTSYQGTYAIAAVPDADQDGVPDRSDVCPLAYDPAQTDTGGVGSGSPPDGVGDACQCGDVSGDGFVTLLDATLIARAQLQPPAANLPKPGLCDVGGQPGCSLADAVTVRRALLVPPAAAIAAQCASPLAP